MNRTVQPPWHPVYEVTGVCPVALWKDRTRFDELSVLFGGEDGKPLLSRRERDAYGRWAADALGAPDLAVVLIVLRRKRGSVNDNSGSNSSHGEAA